MKPFGDLISDRGQAFIAIALWALGTLYSLYLWNVWGALVGFWFVGTLAGAVLFALDYFAHKDYYSNRRSPDTDRIGQLSGQESQQPHFLCESEQIPIELR